MICDDCRRRDADTDMMCPVAGIVDSDADSCIHYAQIPVSFGGDSAVPAGIKCPECSGLLYVEVYEWESATGRPTFGGYTVDCCDDSNDMTHKYHQSDWQSIIDRVGKWLGAVDA